MHVSTYYIVLAIRRAQCSLAFCWYTAVTMVVTIQLSSVLLVQFRICRAVGRDPFFVGVWIHTMVTESDLGV